MSPRSPEPPDFAASQLFLRRLAFHLVRDSERAEDLVQETWATWVERRPRGIGEPRAWLARVLRNRAFNLKRADERRLAREELAGTPDASAPETDGTLEAQSQLLEALRRLEEPFRSALVQRYYHDLAPSAIAGRTGTPLNTVKARLARGLEKLRAEMDKRYHGDRKAWCHWLTVLGAPPVAVPVPKGIESAASGGAPLATAGGSASLLGWLGVAAAIAAITVWKSGWRSAERPEQVSEHPAVAAPPVSERVESEREPAARKQRERIDEDVATAPRPAVTKLPEPVPSPVGSEVLRPVGGSGGFDWPQYGGGPEHDNFRARKDEIFVPKVLWFLPGLAGQPTLAGGALYSGGAALARLDPDTGTPQGIFFDQLGDTIRGRTKAEILGELSQALRGMDETKLQELAQILRGGDPNEWPKAFAPAPLIADGLLLARQAMDGSVIAFDRELKREVWRWDSEWDEGADSPYTRVPLCFADGFVLVALQSQLIALRVKDGREAWRFDCNGKIAMVPACAKERVFFGADRGQFFALDLRSGRKLWQAQADAFGAAAPVVVEKRVFVADERGLPWNGAPSTGQRLHAFDVGQGWQAWEEPYGQPPFSSLGIGERGRTAVAGLGTELVRLELASGKQREHLSIPLGTGAIAPAIVGQSLVFGTRDGRLCVHALEGDELRWAFQLPAGAAVQDFVHTGSRIYLATSIGLFCLADDPTRAAVAAGFVLEWKGDPREPSVVDEEPR